jgi:hypothetical protein
MGEGERADDRGSGGYSVIGLKLRNLMKMKLLFALALLICICLFAQPTQTFLYSAASGDTTCKFHTNSPTPTTVDFTCSNARGTFGGYYAPLPSNTATDVIVTGLEGPVGNTGSVTCMMAINMTAGAVVIGAFGPVPSSSVVFQCAGGAQSPVIPLQ